MNPMNRREAIRESLLDFRGADCLMVKTGRRVSDVLREIRANAQSCRFLALPVW